MASAESPLSARVVWSCGLLAAMTRSPMSSPRTIITSILAALSVPLALSIDDVDASSAAAPEPFARAVTVEQARSGESTRPRRRLDCGWRSGASAGDRDLEDNGLEGCRGESPKHEVHATGGALADDPVVSTIPRDPGR